MSYLHNSVTTPVGPDFRVNMASGGDFSPAIGSPRRISCTDMIIFDLYGPNGYRRMERETLESILKQILRGTIIYK